jgi:hypothetical protein
LSFKGTYKNRFSPKGTKKRGGSNGIEKWVLFYGNIQNGFSSMGTYKMGSLLWEHTKWVLFYGNIKNGLSSMGT